MALASGILEGLNQGGSMQVAMMTRGHITFRYNLYAPETFLGFKWSRRLDCNMFKS